VMGAAELGMPFDIHTGGIDHREIHHPNEIAQNQAHECSAHTGASIWMHNNFLIERSGKMSKSSGDFLRLQLLFDKGFHPLAYRLMCLQAHYRSELEFSWEGLQAALTRLKRMVMAYRKWDEQLKEGRNTPGDSWERERVTNALVARFDAAVSADLNTADALTVLEEVLSLKGTAPECVVTAASHMDRVLGLKLGYLARTDLRLRPNTAIITEDEIEAILAQRKEARAAKDFARSDALRDELAAKGVEAMDGDPLGWDWKLEV
jgi:cysteinyl-tRNA synthetase